MSDLRPREALDNQKLGNGQGDGAIGPAEARPDRLAALSPTMPQMAKVHRPMRRIVFWAVFLLLCGGVAAAAYFLRQPEKVKTSGNLLADVVRGPLVISVIENGEVEAELRKTISNELSWPVVIRKVVPEGSTVKEGDTIVLFECKELMDALSVQRITVTGAKNAYTAARENLVLKKKELDNKVQKAEQAVKDAEEDLKRYKEGQAKINENDARSAVLLAEGDLALAKDKLAFKKKANANPELNNPYSQNEIQADELAVARLELALSKAKSTLDMLLKYDDAREERKLGIAVTDAKLEKERAGLEAKTQLLVSEAEEQSKKATLDLQQSKLDDYVEDEKKLLVKAEKSGLVVYDTGSRGWTGSDVIVDVGQRINPRQQLMIIPDMTTLQVKTKVYEAIIDQVAPGQEAFMRTDARPDEMLTGKIHRVAVLPGSQHRWLSPNVKIFDVIVKLDDPKMLASLKPGMTAKVELILARLENVLSVPVASVFTEQDRTYVYRVRGDKQEKVQVQVGRMNESRVVITSGLSDGDKVLLAPREAQAGPQQGQAEEGGDTGGGGKSLRQAPGPVNGGPDAGGPDKAAPDKGGKPGKGGKDKGGKTPGEMAPGGGMPAMPPGGMTPGGTGRPRPEGGVPGGAGRPRPEAGAMPGMGKKDM